MDLAFVEVLRGLLRQRDPPPSREARPPRRKVPGSGTEA